MDTERWSRLEELLAVALDLSASERSALVKKPQAIPNCGPTWSPLSRIREMIEAIGFPA